MHCLNCGLRNQRNARFCTRCGHAIGEVAPGTVRTDIGRLEAQIVSLRSHLNEITDALRERGIDLPTPPEPEVLQAPVEPQPVAERPSEPVATTAPADQRAPIKPPPSRRESLPNDVVRQALAGPRRRSPVAEAISNFDWEPIIGGNWLARVGALAVIIGVAFFLALAFENDWITEPMRVVLGVVAALAFVGAGEYWRLKYPAYAQALTGTGVALFYLSIFAAFANYDLIHIYTGVSLLLLISVASAVIAIRQDSVSLAVIGIAGAFLAPFILGTFAETGLSNRADAATRDAPALLAYIVAVDVGVIILSTFKNWQWFTALALAGSLATFGLWHTEYIDASNVLIDHYGRGEAFLIAEAGLAGIFVSFLAATTLFHLVWRRTPEPLDLILILVNATFFMGISYALLWDEFKAWMGLFTILVSLVYGGLGYVAFRRVGITAIDVRSPDKNMLLTSTLLGIALVLITIAVPIQIGGPWIAATWAAEGLMLFWLSFRFKMPELRIGGILAFIASAFWLGIIDTPEAFEETLTPFWNRYLPAYLVVIASLWGTAFLARRHDNQLSKDEKDLFPMMALFAILFMALLTPVQVRGPWLGFWWTLEAVALLILAFSIRSTAIRYGALAVLAVSSLWLAAIETPELFDTEVTPFWNALFPLYLVVLAGVAASAYLFRRNADQLRAEESAVFPALLLTGIGLLALGTPVQLDHQWNTVGWSVEAVALTWFGHRFKIQELQMLAPLLLMPAAVRALALDSVVESDGYTVFWNTRLLSFGPLIAGICGVAFFWSRLAPTPMFKQPQLAATILVVVANFLLIFFLSAEVIGAVQADAVIEVEARNESDTISLGLTVLWAAYGGLVLGAGFIGGWRSVRLGGLILLAIPVLKLFLVDSFQLDRGFRVAAFLTLGAILLIGGYIYQRNTELFNELFIGRRRPEGRGTA